MFTAVLAVCALAIAFFYPLAAPWRKRSLYVWLAMWFASWLSFFYVATREAYHYEKASISPLVMLLIVLMVSGSIIRIMSRGLAGIVGRRRARNASAMFERGP